MFWKAHSKMKLLCGVTCLVTLIVIILNQPSTKNVGLVDSTSDKTHHASNLSAVAKIQNSNLNIPALNLNVPKWISKLSRAIKDSKAIPLGELEDYFSDARFYSYPPVDFNSTVVQNILLDLEQEEYDPELKVPNIVHLVWFYYPKRPAFRFHNVICLLSIRKFIKPEKILFWYDIEPTGRWWLYIKEIMNNILMVHRKAPSRIFHHRIRIPEHKADVARLEAILAIGGVYVDLDTVILNPFTSLRHHNVTLGAESPESLGNGVIVAAPNSTFLWIVYNSYYTFDKLKWNYHSVRLPMMIARQYPHIIHIEWHSMLRPNWHETSWIYDKGKLWDWKNNYCIHLYYRVHGYEYNPDSIKRLNTTMGEVFRYIYYGDSDVIDDRRR